METRTIPHTVLTVSRACLGTMTFGAQCDETTACRMLELCLDQGINFIDTANVYAGGASEKILGSILRNRRHRVVLASKVGIPTGDVADQRGLSRAAIVRAIDESLTRLQTDYLDIYYLHQPDHSVAAEESLSTLEDLRVAGKIRYPAASNYAAWQICQMQSLARAKGFGPIHIAQPLYNLLSRGAEQEFFPMAKSLDVYTLAYNPLAGGLLTGKHGNNMPQPGTRFEQIPGYMTRYWHSVNHDAVEQFRSLARQAERSMISLAMNWILHHTAADGIILGASSADQLRENLAALNDGSLSSQTVAACDEIWHRLRGVAPQYNR
jgi:1-deoxyxylulose-5-phosphate synthase